MLIISLVDLSVDQSRLKRLVFLMSGKGNFGVSTAGESLLRESQHGGGASTAGESALPSLYCTAGFLFF